jgi:hypothetical protein
MMPIILPNNTLTTQFPQPRIVITTRRNQIRAVRAERAIPHPPLVSVQCCLEREGIRIAFGCGRELVGGCGVVRGGEIE